MSRAYEEIVDFFAHGSTPSGVVSWKPSETTLKRVAELLDRQKQGNLTDDDKNELGHYLELEHLMRLVKARARIALQEK